MTHPFRSIPRRLAILAVATLVAVGLTAVPATQDRAEANHGCVRVLNHLVCELHLNGGFDYYIDADPEVVLKLVNNTGEHVQINSVWMDPVVHNLWGEFCGYLDLHETRQDPEAPGIGEVGCSNKRASEQDFRPLRWDDGSSPAIEGLSVPPGSEVYIGGYVHDGEKDLRKTFRVRTSPQTRGVLSYRQPKADRIIPCNGARQVTAWGPWKNTTGHDLMIGGAWIYSEPDAANIYILNSAGNVRWTHFGANTRGLIDFPNHVVHPNESIVGHASHTCPVGQTWDWVAYILTWNS